MKVKAEAKHTLKSFIQKPKFEAQPGTIYNGLSDQKLKPVLTKLINQAASDFLYTVDHQPTEAKFQNNIKLGLARFNALYMDLDTEDRERVCAYFEELMDCVGHKSSNGLLNDWMYNFDPSKKTKPE